MSDNPNTAGPGEPQSRWFQFRLRTLLIGTAVLSIVLGGYVAHEARIVAMRKAMLETGPFTPLRRFSVRLGNDENIPMVRRWLGDHGLVELAFYQWTDENIQRYKTAFPEWQQKPLAPPPPLPSGPQSPP